VHVFFFFFNENLNMNYDDFTVIFHLIWL
jgi:hypothetical protein